MRTTITTLAFLALAPLGLAQVTGVPGLNDYTINGQGSGSTSCTKVDLPSLGTNILILSVSGPPNTPVILAFSACPCSPGFFNLGLAACTPPSAIQSIDLNLFWPLITLDFWTDGFGNLTLVVPCPPNVTFATQAAVFDVTCPWLWRLTQAYDVCC